MLKAIRPCCAKLRRVTLNGPPIPLRSSRDTRHRRLGVRHRQSTRAAHVEMRFDIRSHRRALAEMRMEIEPLGKREGHELLLTRDSSRSTVR